MSLGVSISFWTVQTSFFTFIITFGVLQGLGVGLAYAQALTLSCRWFPAHGGLINGLIVAGFGCGGAIFNELITNYINPDNEQATSIVDGKNYFDKKSVLDRVPSFFYVLGQGHRRWEVQKVVWISQCKTFSSSSMPPNSTPCRQPTLSRPNSCPGIGRPHGKFSIIHRSNSPCGWLTPGGH
jgi:hypothetical protein